MGANDSWAKALVELAEAVLGKGHDKDVESKILDVIGEYAKGEKIDRPEIEGLIRLVLDSQEKQLQMKLDYLDKVIEESNKIATKNLFNALFDGSPGILSDLVSLIGSISKVDSEDETKEELEPEDEDEGNGGTTPKENSE